LGYANFIFALGLMLWALAAWIGMRERAAALRLGGRRRADAGDLFRSPFSARRARTRHRDPRARIVVAFAGSRRPGAGRADAARRPRRARMARGSGAARSLSRRVRAARTGRSAAQLRAGPSLLLALQQPRLLEPAAHQGRGARPAHASHPGAIDVSGERAS